jgi:hypothetical protein
MYTFPVLFHIEYAIAPNLTYRSQFESHSYVGL